MNLSQGILALSSSTGLVTLPTIISLSRTLARLAIGLDKRPDLIAHLTRRESSIGSEEAAERVTLVESSANVIREAFKKCLSERSGPPSGIDTNGKPEGRRRGIYITANLCLKLFFHCRKLRSAEQIFGNIYQQSPPLALFPASQRVTYLYYLGRYLFANSHFFRAQLALQAAYTQCHARCLKQRRLILIYLITSNIIVGRFPSTQLLSREEASGLKSKFSPLSSKFLPICTAIAKGDLKSFHNLLSLDNEHAEWFFRYRILLQLSNRCEILVWRSLARKTFVLSGTQGDATSKVAPTLDLRDLLTLSTYLESQALILPTSAPTLNNPQPLYNPQTNPISLLPTSPPDIPDPPDPLLPTMPIIESTIASLIDQGLLHGFISHKSQRFAITGAKNANPLQVGFPTVWETVCAKSDPEVPGWVQETDRKTAVAGEDGAQMGIAGGLGRKYGPGMVVNLTGARPVGVGGE